MSNQIDKEWKPMYTGLLKPENEGKYVDVEIEGEGVFTGQICLHGNDIVFDVITYGRLLRYKNIRDTK